MKNNFVSRNYDANKRKVGEYHRKAATAAKKDAPLADVINIDMDNALLTPQVVLLSLSILAPLTPTAGMYIRR